MKVLFTEHSATVIQDNAFSDSLLGGRSGNRGQCAQPCRLPYKVDGTKESSYVLSLKDICTLEYIPELVEAGIYSFKIEGRMKKPEYVALVTAMYRKYTDLYLKSGKKGFRVEPKDREKLMDLYNRGGSHGGYYHTKNGREMVSLERPNHAGVPALKVLKQNGKSVTAQAIVDIHEGDIVELPDEKENFTFAKTVKSGQNITFTTHKKQNLVKGRVLNRTRNESLLKEINETILSKKIKEKMNGKLILSAEESAKLMIDNQSDIVVEVSGDVAQEAINQPMEASRIEKQMRKTGNTEFEFDALEIELQGNLFMPMQSLNELRRKGIEALEEKILSASRREEPRRKVSMGTPEEEQKTISGFCVYVETTEQFEEVVNSECVRRIYLDCNAVDTVWNNRNTEKMIEKAHCVRKEIFFVMPYIFRADTCERYEQSYEAVFGQGWDGVLIRNYESFEFLSNHKYPGKIVTDYNLYQFNKYAKMFWQQKGAESMTAPLELNYREMEKVGLENSELVIYGYFPMMVSAQCVTKTTKGCRHKKGLLTMKDRYQKEFTIKNNCDYCYNVIYNTAPVVLTDQKEEIKRLHPKSLRLHFTIESRAEVREILKLYKDVFVEDGQAREPDMEFTRGHFKRGIK